MPKSAGRVPQVVEHLPSKSEALNSNPNTTQKIVIKVHKRKIYGKTMIQCTFPIKNIEYRIYEALCLLGETRYPNRKRRAKRIQQTHHKRGDI
jgi:hypothetical protein